MIRTTSQSDNTVVPPVTALRSPPLSRITGALSPVTALSLTEATPSMISPSMGIMSPASTRTTSPFLSCDEAILVTSASGDGFASRLAVTSRRVLRRDSAWALPLPSAMDSAKLAKSTVIQSQTDICRMKDGDASPFPVKTRGRRGGS